MIGPHVRPMLLSSIWLIAFGCTGTEVGTARAHATIQLETAPMPIANQKTATRALPPIDAEAPTAYQTATFALG